MPLSTKAKDLFLISLSETIMTELAVANFLTLPDPRKVFVAIWRLESLVNNGGFDSYFRFTGSYLIAYAPTALRTIGAHSMADIVRRAIEMIQPLSPNQHGRYQSLDRFSKQEKEALYALSKEFWAYPDSLTTLLFEHVRQHPEVFGPTPDA